MHESACEGGLLKRFLELEWMSLHVRKVITGEISGVGVDESACEEGYYWRYF